MTKVLITGATAQQCNPVLHQRSVNFAGLMHDTLHKAGVEVTWQDPSSSFESIELEQFDHVLVGISSPLSLAANRSYAALNLIGQLYDDPRLSLFIDAPDPNNITRGLQAVKKNPQTLTKELFSYRKDYEKMSDPVYRVRAFAVCEALRSQPWPRVLVPAFPWVSQAQIEAELPSGAMFKSVQVNLDASIVSEFSKNIYDDPKEDRWMAERGINRKWLSNLALSQPVLSLKSDYRQELNEYFASRLQTSTGFLHAPGRKGLTWWTPKIAIALSQGTPVFSAWRETGTLLGGAWNVLPGTFESFSEESKRNLGQAQCESYIAAISTEEESALRLFEALGLETVS
jgi:hypothetical protein